MYLQRQNEYFATLKFVKTLLFDKKRCKIRRKLKSKNILTWLSVILQKRIRFMNQMKIEQDEKNSEKRTTM